MRIAASTINLESSCKLTETRSTKEALTFWRDEGAADTLTLSKEAQGLFVPAPPAACQEETQESALRDEDRLLIKLVESFVKVITGKKIRIKIPDIRLKDPEVQKSAPVTIQNQNRLGWGLVYQASQETYESESMSFTASGRVITADGREITLDLQLNMNREFYSRTDISLRMGDAAKIDPLVINYSGSAPELSAARYSFDLDCDGAPDQISFLTGGSGFLALDKNGDGLINNGSELFGPQSGNGFADLAVFDEDGNDWIDDNDPILSRLRIWIKDPAGQDRLLVLGQVE